METTIKKLDRLKSRVSFMGEHKTKMTKQSKENYQKDLKEIPNLISDLSKEIQADTWLKREFDNALVSFNYWK